MALDYRKPHVIHGAGPGRDVIIQDGRLYDRAGGALPYSLKEIAELGIPVTNELNVHLKIQQVEREVAAERREIEARVAAVRQELERKMKEGLPLDDPEDEVEDSDDISLEGLAELEASLQSNAESSRVRKK